MPERGGYKTDGGWSAGNERVNGNSVSQTLTVNDRDLNTPDEYKASKWIEFTDGFVSGNTDEFVAYIADGSNTTPSHPNGSGGENNSYRYGFNGQERDDEIEGMGNLTTALFWEYDARICRRWNIDPASSKHASESPYLTFHNNPNFYTDPFGDDPPEGFEKHKGQGGDIYLPKGATVYNSSCSDPSGNQQTIIDGFTIGKKTFTASYDNAGNFKGYFSSNQKYENPDVSVSSGGFTGADLQDLNVTFSVKNIPCSGLEVIQLCSSTQFYPWRHKAIRRGGVAINSDGFIPDQYMYYLQGAGLVAGEVDAGTGSYWYYQLPNEEARLRFDMFHPNPYFVGGSSTWDRSTNSGTVKVEDAVSAWADQNIIRFKTIIVARNYMSSGRDQILTSFSWEWSYGGNIPMHGKDIKLNYTEVNKTDREIIDHYYKGIYRGPL